MSSTALCQVCERAEAVHQCPRCGALVCDTHYDPERGVCTECAREVGGEEEDRFSGAR